MYKVEFGKVWEVTSQTEFQEAMRLLAEAEFCAEMSDDYGVTVKEKFEIDRQRAQIKKSAILIGIEI